jgi:hypothetical protein
VAGSGRDASALPVIVGSNLPAVLSQTERKELADCEAIIAKGWDTFVEVGRALTRIRDSKLYRERHATFEAYCRVRWHYAKSQAYRLIGAAQVVACLSPIGDIPKPSHEAQVRPLIGLKPEQAVAAWKKAVEKAAGRGVTARLVKRVVEEHLGTQTKKSSLLSPKRAVAPSRKRAVTEALQWLKRAEDSVRSGGEAKATLKLLMEIRKCLRKFGR